VQTIEEEEKEGDGTYRDPVMVNQNVSRSISPSYKECMRKKNFSDENAKN